jgi:hypothetical protein
MLMNCMSKGKADPYSIRGLMLLSIAPSGYAFRWLANLCDLPGSLASDKICKGSIMSTGDRAEVGAAKVKPKVSPMRNLIGVILLVVFSCAAFLEISSNRAYTSAITKLEARMPKDSTDPSDKNGTLPSQVEVEKLIGKAPSGPLVKEGGEQKATYSWQGLRKKYLLKAYYTNEKAPNLIRIETQ